MKLKGLIGLTAVVLLVIGGAAWATIPDSGGVIHACYSTSSNPNTRGTLRVIDTEAGETCASNESPLTWGQFEKPLYVKVQTFPFRVDPQSQTLECNPGDIATGGGFRLGASLGGLIRVDETSPTLSLSGWNLSIQNDAGTSTTAEIYVVCKDLT